MGRLTLYCNEVDPKTKWLKKVEIWNAKRFPSLHGFRITGERERQIIFFFLFTFFFPITLDRSPLFLSLWSIISYGFPYKTQIHGFLQVRDPLPLPQSSVISVSYTHTFFFGFNAFRVLEFSELWVRFTYPWLFRKFDPFSLNNSETIWHSRCPLLFRKIPRDLTEASLSGAGLSIVAALIMMLLFGMVSSFFFFLMWSFHNIISVSVWSKIWSFRSWVVIWQSTLPQLSSLTRALMVTSYAFISTSGLILFCV